MNDQAFTIPVRRNIAEYGAILGWWLVVLLLFRNWQWSPHWLNVLIVLACWVKSGLFGAENLKQLFEAARSNLSHHRFLLLMGINMTQMILSFALDFHLLYSVQPGCFSGVSKGVNEFEAIFDFFYLSTLNFSFFGYSDILPQTVPAKIVNLTEIVLAFVTVIFMLSDFISLKDSLRTGK